MQQETSKQHLGAEIIASLTELLAKNGFNVSSDFTSVRYLPDAEFPFLGSGRGVGLEIQGVSKINNEMSALFPVAEVEQMKLALQQFGEHLGWSNRSVFGIEVSFSAGQERGSLLLYASRR